MTVMIGTSRAPVGQKTPGGTTGQAAVSGPGLLPIIECGDPVLRRPAEPVSPADLRSGELELLIAQMRATMEAAPGVGLAAPQVGVPIQLAVLYDGPERFGQLTEDERTLRERDGLPFTVLVNPVARPVDDGDRVSFYEGCLSVPGLTGVVARYRAVQVEALDEHGEPVDEVFSGWAARIVQQPAGHHALPAIGSSPRSRIEIRTGISPGARNASGRPAR